MADFDPIDSSTTRNGLTEVIKVKSTLINIISGAKQRLGAAFNDVILTGVLLYIMMIHIREHLKNCVNSVGPFLLYFF